MALAGLATLGLWIPADVETGIIEVWRRQVEIGDALAPTVAAAGLTLSGLALFLTSLRGKGGAGMGRGNVVWTLVLLLVFVVALALMRWTGPILADLLGAGEYRLLRASVPWKYLGYLAGGFTLVFGLMALVERRLSWRRAGLAALAVVLLAALYDLPFEDLQLPPNGDV